MSTDQLGRVAGPTILLASGRYFDVDNPAAPPPTIADIAWSLAQASRWSGQCFVNGEHVFYSVARHSLMMAEVAPPELAFAALLDDASEFAWRDLANPLKKKCDDYRQAEKFTQRALEQAFLVPLHDKDQIKSLDKRMMATERRDLMNWNPDDVWPYLVGVDPFDFIVTPDLSMNATAEQFIDTFYRLGGSDT